jgi:hypothetical protein
MAQQKDTITDNPYVIWGLLGFIAYVLYQDWQLQETQANPPQPSYISPSTICN